MFPPGSYCTDASSRPFAIGPLSRYTQFMRDIFDLFLALIKVRLFRRQIPLFLGWNLTFRCNLNCRYCGASAARGPELDTGDICGGLDALYGMGARWVTFGGGEPLLRPDLGAISDHAAKRGYKVFLSTNGVLLPDRMDDLEAVRHVNLSLDGPAGVHDAVRGRGAFEKTMIAVEACRKARKPVSFQCVLSSDNLQSVRDVVTIAEQAGVSVMFQPATRWLDSSTDPNPIAPDPAAYREAMREVLALKREGRSIRNSVAGLKHLMHWPDSKSIWCPAGRLSCEIEPDGSILACHQAQVALFLKGQTGGGASDAAARFGRMAMPKGCAQCWCAPLVEMALVFSLNPSAVYNAARTMGH